MSKSARLNLDVLAITCEFLTDISDILSFANICSTIRPVAIRWLLSVKPAYLRDSTSVRRFHSFLFVDAPARTPHVRALDIANPSRIPRIPTLPNDLSLLIDILSSCPHLEHVSIYIHDRSGRLTDDPQIIDAIIGTHSLRSLSIHGLFNRTLSALPRICAPLRMVDVGFMNNEIVVWSPGALEMFLPRSLALTLGTLRLFTFTTDLFGTPTSEVSALLVPIRPHLDMATYPVVHSLYVHLFGQRPLLDHLQHFFPALDDTLSLGTLNMSIQSGDALDDLRAANQHAQEHDPAHSHSWKKLDKVVCDPQMLYVLGLRCPIRLIVLDNCTAHSLSCATITLRENPVPHLKLSFRPSRGCDVLLDELFSPELARTLTHLTIFFLFDNRVGGLLNDMDPEAVEHSRWEDFRTRIRSALQPLSKLTHLRIAINSTILYDPASSSAYYLEEFIRAMSASEFDFAGTDTLLTCPHPCLQYIFLTTSGCVTRPGVDSDGMRIWKTDERWYVDRAWRVADPVGTGAGSEDKGGGKPVLVELHEDVAETIIRNEELVLSEKDEALLHLNED